MTTVNVLAVLKNNLPAFRDELLAERERLVGRINVIDAHLKTALELSKVIEDAPPPGDTVQERIAYTSVAETPGR